MMRVRLREAVGDTAAFYADRYPDGYQHAVWPDHVERVDETVRFAVDALTPGYRSLQSVVDLSCGDGRLALALGMSLGASEVVLGDVNPESGPYPGLDVIGSLPDTLVSLPSVCDTPGRVGLYVCSETLEHLDDPDAFLAQLRPLTEYLLLTTPEAETSADNPEHYWGWDSEAVGQMLDSAGFTQVVAHQVFTPLSADVYRFQMWMVR